MINAVESTSESEELGFHSISSVIQGYSKFNNYGL